MAAITAFLSSDDKGHLKAELQNLRRKGALRPSADWDSTGPDPDRSCGRCRVELGRVINRGAYCRACRLKVCKGCREYSFRTTDWVCTVCHKHMEIQAASGEWMNEFVRRPSRRRDNRVYVPAADIIKRTIRRSWTISNPTPRWSVLRGSPELRPYNSLPRGQDINNYPSLALHQANAKNQEQRSNEMNETSPRKHSPCRRTHSEDVYNERSSSPLARTTTPEKQNEQQQNNKRPVRVNPLMRLGENKSTKSKSPRRKSQPKVEEPQPKVEEPPPQIEEQNETNKGNETKTKNANNTEKRVSFDSNIADSKIVLRTQSLHEGGSPKARRNVGPRSRTADDSIDENEVHFAREETTPVELCDIEPLSGTVFRKVTVRRRRQDMRKIPAVDTGWRNRGPDGGDLLDILMPEGDDYKLVFISSDSSSKEEDVDDNDSSSASSFPIDECDWDYFEPGQSAARLNALCSPFGSPSVCRRGSPLFSRRSRESDTTDDDNRLVESPEVKHQSEDEMDELAALQCVHKEDAAVVMPQQGCQSCGSMGGGTQYIPIPVPVPIPFPVPAMWTPQDSLVLYGDARLRGVLPRNLWPYAALIWPLINAGEPGAAALHSILHDNNSECGAGTGAASSSSSMPVVSERDDGSTNVGETDAEKEEPPAAESAPVDDSPAEDAGLSGYVECDDRYESDSSRDSSDSDGDGPRVRRVYNVNGGNDRESDDALPSSNVTSDDDDKSHSSAREDDMSSSGSADTDSDDTGTVADQKPKRFSRTFVVNKNLSSSSSSKSSSSTDTSDNDTDTEMDCTVILTNVKSLDEDEIEASLKTCDSEEQNKQSKDDELSSSPGLSDVSAESLNSSDVEQVFRDAPPEGSSVANQVPESEVVPGSTGEWKTVRSGGPVVGDPTAGGERERAGALLVTGEPDVCVSRHAARYTSLVMITQEPAPSFQPVSVVTSDTTTLVDNSDVIVRHTNWQEKKADEDAEDRPSDNQSQHAVTVITGGDTLSAFEEGLADDDSWVENLSHDEDFDTSCDDSTSGEEVTLTCSAAIDQEDELRGYHRAAIDFTLHTIVEESCEESEVELPSKEPQQLTTDLEKYFFFRLGDGTNHTEDPFSESSSICSEGMDSLGTVEEPPQNDQNENLSELASSRLEKYFLSGFMGFQRRDSDGSVGSDSEGRPSPEQRRKRLVRARGTGRSHSSSLDNLLANPDLSEPVEAQNSEDSSSSDSDTYDESNTFEKADGQFDTVKRKKGAKKLKSHESLEPTQEGNDDDDEDGHKTPQPEPSNLTANQQSRDSGFIGSCDDLLREQKEPEVKEAAPKAEEKKLPQSTPPATSLTRKDSFNNWSSDEETNLMMCKMRQFFKTLVNNSPSNPSNSKPTTPNTVRAKNRCKPPQLVYFENELTRLMKTVPGIRDDQVREIVEYLSSEDTWSDSYDSSDYTSSDLECATNKSALQQQISDSCKQIINKFDNGDEEGDEGDGGIEGGLSRETAFVYQKLMASFEKMATAENEDKAAPHNSPPLIAKVMHHIGSRLVALMHEVSSGESHASNSPKARYYHRRLQQKLSSASTTTTEDDDSTSDSNLPDTIGLENLAPYNLLPRSRSHDLLVGESRTHHQSSSGVSDIAEEREVSDCERFSWRGSFESALLATDSRNKLYMVGGEGSASASALAIAAKRRSAGDLLFSHKSLSREQLDRVRSCGSIGGANSEDKLWVASATRPTRRRSSVPDATCGSGGSADGEDDDDDDDDEDIDSRATLPRSLQGGAATTNSLPRLPTNTSSTNMQKAQSMYHFLPPNAKSARYRPPGFSRLITTVPKRAVSAPGLQPTHQRRGRRSQQQNVPSDDVSISEAHSSPMLASRNGSKSATPSPVAPSSRRGTGSISSQDWSTVNNDDDIDRLVVIHQARSSLSSLGLRSDSMASVYSGAGEGRYGTVTVRGQVEFGLQYNYKAGALEILIKQCKDLAPVDAKRNRSDPYVKVYLLPDKSKSGKRKTKVKKHTLNPVFEESLKFHISLNGLETRTLWLTVWHSDMFGRNDFLGEVMMTLENKVFDDPTPKWYNLQERTEPFDDMLSFKGDIIVCLKFVPPDMTVSKKGKRSRGTLHVLVKEAKSLTAVKANGTSDPFCKSYLLPDKGRSSKQKTPVAKRTVNPVWNHTFVYDDVTLQELAERCLELTVWDHDRLASNEFLGGVRFSLGTGKHYGKPVDWMDATGKEHSLWKSMLERPNFWVEGCLSLRPSLDARAS